MASLCPDILALEAGVRQQNLAKSSRMQALFVDRDGVLCKNRADYVLSTDDVEIIAGARDALREAASRGCLVIIVSNQACVGKGLISVLDAVEVHVNVLRLLQGQEDLVTASYICPHVAEAKCSCRKPLPGMLSHALARWHLNREDCFMVGDAESDVRAADRAGIRSALVLTGRGAKEDLCGIAYKHSQPGIKTSLLEAIKDWLGTDRGRAR